MSTPLVKSFSAIGRWKTNPKIRKSHMQGVVNIFLEKNCKHELIWKQITHNVCILDADLRNETVVFKSIFSNYLLCCFSSGKTNFASGGRFKVRVQKHSNNRRR
jgi:hypothetical protein